MSVPLGELAVRFGCELRGDPGVPIERVGTLANAQAGALAFLANPKYRSQLAGTRAAAVILTAAAAEACPAAMLVCENPYATYGAGTVVGARSVLHPGVVLGADGFGFAPERGSNWVKVPQVGIVRIGADVEIGANTTVDRGAIEDTVIGDDVKLDNLVQVGHNVRIGAHTVIAGCTGISGSTTIGARCMIGGACGIGGHINIVDDVVATGFSAIANSITKPGLYSSTLPAEEARTWRRLQANFKRAGVLAARVRRLEQATGLKSEQEPTDE